MKECIISAKGLCKSFVNEGVQNHVLSGIDLDIYRGDFTVIMGVSGSGKSTLMYALSGMDRATSGSITYNGTNIAAAKENKLAQLHRSDFGFVFQQIHLVSNLTLRENIEVAGYLSGKYHAKDVKKEADELISRMNIEKCADNLPQRTSGGEQQRSAIARAVIHKPELVFADEPTGALNRAGTETVLDLLSELNREGQSILMVTHDREAALRGSRIVYLSDGKIIGELELPVYDASNTDSRRAQLSAWLESLKW